MRFLRFLLLALLFPSAGAFAFQPFFHAYGRAGDFREGGGAQAWIPFYQGCDWVTFAEVRLLRLREQWNGSGGGGIRKMFCSTIGVGANAFFDYSRADGAGGFWQGCGGVEIFGPCWDVTANYYHPDRRRKLADFRTEFENFIDGTQILADEFLVFDRVRAYRGYDVNVGLTVPLCWGRIKGRGGYFRYTSPSSQVVEGPRMRLYWEVDSPFCPWTGTRWSIGGEWQHDNVRKEQAAIVVTLRFNLCAGPGIEQCNPCYSGICRRMNDPVDRELGITIIRDQERELFDTQLIANIFFVEQNGMGVGSQTDPTNLLVAETNSVAGDFIFLLNDNGEIDVSILPDDTFDMKANQTMVSFDESTQATLNLGTFGTLTVVDLTGAGRGVLGGATMPAVALADDNVVCGIGVDGGPVAISGMGVANPFIDLNLFTTQTANAIALATVSDVTIQNNIIEDYSGPSAAIDLTNASGTTTVSGNTIRNLTGLGNVSLILTNTNISSTVQITNNAIGGTLNTFNGIFLEAIGIGTTSTSISNNTLNGLTGLGIVATKTGIGGTLAATVENNTITDFAGNTMIQITSSSQGSNVSFAVTNNMLTTTTSANAIEILPSSSGAAAQAFQGRVTGNILTGIMGTERIFIDSTLMNTGDVLRVAAENNVFSGGAGAGAAAIRGQAGDSGTLSWTYTGNIDTSGSTGAAAYQAETIGTFTDTLCVTMMSNNTNNVMGIDVTNGGGTVDVTDLANLSANNNNIGVTTSGVIGTTGACPLPP